MGSSNREMPQSGRGFLLLLILAAACIIGAAFPVSARAAANLTVTPLTWNVIGLDSNDVNSGPNDFPVGARVCNTGDATATNLSGTLVWDTTPSPNYISIRPGTNTTISAGDLAPNACTDLYFEVEVTRNSAAYDTTRRYEIDVTADGGSTTGKTPTPRELYVEHLISQNRNSISDVKLDGTSIPAGGSMTLVVGNTYQIELDGGTATQGYNQFEAFINFPNTIFQILSVSTLYSADNSPYVQGYCTTLPTPCTPANDKLYADACGWDNNPSSPTYRSCVGGDYKAGGSNVVTTYTVKILSGAGTSETLNTLLYDFSGSSYHYNGDYSTGARIVNIIGPSSVTIAKSFVPKAIAPGGTSTMTFTLTNPTSQTFAGVNFSDDTGWPGGLEVYGTPGLSYSGCGASPSPSSLSGGETSLSFSNITLNPYSTCTITVDVTASSDGAYTNTTDDLFIDTSIDTGNTGSDTLTVSSAPPPPSSCASRVTLATWTMADGNDTYGFPLFNSKAADVNEAKVSYSGSGAQSIDTTTGNPANSWKAVDGWSSTATGFPNPASPYFQVDVDTRNYGGVTIAFDYALFDNQGWGGSNTLYIYSSADDPTSDVSFVNIYNASATKNSWQNNIANATASATGTGITSFRINATAKNGTKTSDGLYLDNIVVTGCPRNNPNPPTIIKSFGSSPIALNDSTTLTFTIENPNSGSALSGVSFTDELPAGITAADDTTNDVCGIGSSLAVSGNTITLSGGSLAANGSCTINVTVTGAAAGTFTNVSGNVSATESGTNTTSSGYATASLTVTAPTVPPVLFKSFSPTSILTGGTSTLTFTITNPNLSGSLSGIGFTDTLPTGITPTNGNGTTSNLCGTGSLNISGNTLTFSGGSLAAGGSCSFDVTVTGSTAGTKNNTTTAVTSGAGNGNTASATLLVSDPVSLIGLNKEISTDQTNWYKFLVVTPTTNVYYRFTVSNEGETALDPVSVDDPNVTVCTLSSSLAVGDSSNCVTSPVTAQLGDNPNTATATGTYNSTDYTISSSADYFGATGSFSLLKQISSSSAGPWSSSINVAAGSDVYYKFTLINAEGFDLSSLSVTDDTLPSGSTDACAFSDPLVSGSATVCTVGPVTASGTPGDTVTNTATGSGTNGGTYTTPDSSASYTIPVQYTVTATATGNGTGTVSSNTGGISYGYQTNNTGTTSALDYGTNVVLTATAGTGSTVSWTTCSGTTGGTSTAATCTFSSLDGNKTAQATFTQSNLFDPPMGLKTVDGSGYPELRWRMVWINNGNTTAVMARVVDPIPFGVTYVAGSLQCFAQGTSTTTTCTYDSAQNRVVWEGDIAADSGATNENNANNEIIIQFRTTVSPSVTSVQNQGCAYWDSNGDNSLSDEILANQTPVCSDDPGTQAAGDQTVWAKDQAVAVPALDVWGIFAMVLIAGILSLAELRRRRRSGASEMKEE